MGTDLAIVSLQVGTQRPSPLRNSLARNDDGNTTPLRPAAAVAGPRGEGGYEHPVPVMDYRCLELEPGIRSSRPGLTVYREVLVATARDRKGTFICLYA